jgi:hypothetical protein
LQWKAMMAEGRVKTAFAYRAGGGAVVSVEGSVGRR